MLDPNKKYYIEGIWILGKPRNEDDVFMCGPWDEYIKEDGKTLWINGDWIPRFKYEARNKWFPYDPENDRNLQPRLEFKKFKYDKEKKELVKVPEYSVEEHPHPPMYWDINGKRLPGNETLPKYELHIPNARQQREANIYRSFSTSWRIPAVIIACIFCTICFNDAWAAWVAGIGYIIYGLYKEYKNRW